MLLYFVVLWIINYYCVNLHLPQLKYDKIKLSDGNFYFITGSKVHHEQFG